MFPIVSILERGSFTVRLSAYSSQREDYEEVPFEVEVCSSESWLRTESFTEVFVLLNCLQSF
jgi:hypothetical protein